MTYKLFHWFFYHLLVNPSTPNKALLLIVMKMAEPTNINDYNDCFGYLGAVIILGMYHVELRVYEVSFYNHNNGIKTMRMHV